MHTLHVRTRHEKKQKNNRIANPYNSTRYIQSFTCTNLFKDKSTMTSEQFLKSIHNMNEVYELPTFHTVTPERMEALYSILSEELQEIQDIDITDTVQAKVDLADLLADVVVYCFSEAARHGIPMMDALAIVMKSNESKLGSDGRPIKDDRGKFLKGPNFEPPEPELRKMILSRLGSDS